MRASLIDGQIAMKYCWLALLYCCRRIFIFVECYVTIIIDVGTAVNKQVVVCFINWVYCY